MDTAGAIAEPGGALAVPGSGIGRAACRRPNRRHVGGGGGPLV